MTVLLKGFLVAGLLAGTSMTPALAQRHDNRSMQASQNRQVVRYREVTATRQHKWRKGQRLAQNQQRYVVTDWSRRGLRAPPRGYRWVREDNNSGDYLLVAAATGLIASILSQ
ncbi:MAG: putative secreted protein [Alphaproteobacteria bacterium]|nr:putative secreted protein [Alphaproteobacteria bacterium]